MLHSCGEGFDPSPKMTSCKVGYEGCPCTGGGGCNPKLVCKEPERTCQSEIPPPLLKNLDYGYTYMLPGSLRLCASSVEAQCLPYLTACASIGGCLKALQNFTRQYENGTKQEWVLGPDKSGAQVAPVTIDPWVWMANSGTSEGNEAAASLYGCLRNYCEMEKFSDAEAQSSNYEWLIPTNYARCSSAKCKSEVNICGDNSVCLDRLLSFSQNFSSTNKGYTLIEKNAFFEIVEKEIAASTT